jgi:hypothetical protein
LLISKGKHLLFLRIVPVGVFIVEIAASEHLKRVIGRILQLVNNFIETSKKFKIKHHNNKLFKKILKHDEQPYKRY